MTNLEAEIQRLSDEIHFLHYHRHYDREKKPREMYKRLASELAVELAKDPARYRSWRNRRRIRAIARPGEAWSATP